MIQHFMVAYVWGARYFFSVSTTVLPISEVYLRFYTGRTYLELSFLLGPEMIGVV